MFKSAGYSNDMKTIKNILLFLMCLIGGCNAVMAQTPAPVSPVGPLTTTTTYYEPSTGRFPIYRGITYLWTWPLMWHDSTYYITPYYAAHHFAPISPSGSYIQNKYGINTPQTNAKISIDDSLKTSGVVRGRIIKTDSLVVNTPFFGSPVRDNYFTFKNSNIRSGRLGIFQETEFPVGVRTQRERWFLGSGGAFVLVPGERTGDSHSGGVLIGDRDIVYETLFGSYVQSQVGRIAWVTSVANHDYNFTPSFTHDIITYDTLKNVNIIDPHSIFTTYGQAKYNAARPLGNLDFLYPGKADSLYAPISAAGYVPYTGSTTDLNHGQHASLYQSVATLSTPASGLVKLYNDSSLGFGWLNPAGTFNSFIPTTFNASNLRYTYTLDINDNSGLLIKNTNSLDGSSSMLRLISDAGLNTEIKAVSSGTAAGHVYGPGDGLFSVNGPNAWIIANNASGTIGFAVGGSGTSSFAGKFFNNGHFVISNLATPVDDGVHLFQSAGSGKFFGTVTATNIYGTQSVDNPVVVNNVAALATIPITGVAVRVLGYTTAGDGGGFDVYYNGSSSATLDGGSAFATVSGGTTRWIRVKTPTVDPVSFGCDITATTDNRNNWQYMLNYCNTNGVTIVGKPTYNFRIAYIYNLVWGNVNIDGHGMTLWASLPDTYSWTTYGTDSYTNSNVVNSGNSVISVTVGGELAGAPWNGKASMFVSAANCTIKNLNIDGGWWVTNSNAPAGYPTAKAISGIKTTNQEETYYQVFANSTNVLLQNVNFTNIPGNAVTNGSSVYAANSNVTLDNCSINEFGDHAVYLSGGANVTIDNFHILGSRVASSTEGNRNYLFATFRQAFKFRGFNNIKIHHSDMSVAQSGTPNATFALFEVSSATNYSYDSNGIDMDDNHIYSASVGIQLAGGRYSSGTTPSTTDGNGYFLKNVNIHDNYINATNDVIMNGAVNGYVYQNNTTYGQTIIAPSVNYANPLQNVVIKNNHVYPSTGAWVTGLASGVPQACGIIGAGSVTFENNDLHWASESTTNNLIDVPLQYSMELNSLKLINNRIGAKMYSLFTEDASTRTWAALTSYTGASQTFADGVITHGSVVYYSGLYYQAKTNITGNVSNVNPATDTTDWVIYTLPAVNMYVQGNETQYSTGTYIFSTVIDRVGFTPTLFANDNKIFRDSGTPTYAFAQGGNLDSWAIAATPDQLIDGAKTIVSTANTAAQFNASTGKLEASATTATELGYVHGVTSNIQTQLNTKGIGTVTGGVVNWPGTIYTTPTTATVSTGVLTFAPTLATQSANTSLMGPTSGSAAAPSFRTLVAADIPNLPWSILTSGVPTTLGGYGITDAIKNQTSQQTSANFNIDGTGIIGTKLIIGAASGTASGLEVKGAANNSVPIQRITNGTVNFDLYIGAGSTNAQFGVASNHPLLLFANNGNNGTNITLGTDGTATAGVSFKAPTPGSNISSTVIGNSAWVNTYFGSLAGNNTWAAANAHNADDTYNTGHGLFFQNIGGSQYVHLFAPSVTSARADTLQDDGGKIALTKNIATQKHTIFTPTTGATVALGNNQYNIINPAGALLALTVTVPSSPANNDVVYIKYTQSITTVTYSGGTVVDGITSPVGGGLVILSYDSGTSSWY